MDTVAALTTSERIELFLESANKRGVRREIIEKDFWVCWTLKQLFQLTDLGRHLIFKGGTSLSKIFHAIQRFSEDIDISIDRAYLGFEGEKDPENIASRTKQKKTINQLRDICRTKVNEEILPQLIAAGEQILGPREDGNQQLWSITPYDKDPDGQSLVFAYPTQAEEGFIEENPYMKPSVLIEFGARADHWPAEEFPIKPYAAEDFPQYFKEPSHTLKVLAAERTFWEKATLLHSEYHRPEEKATADRISRHYYDLHELTKSEFADRSLAQLNLLKHVVEHKKIFFARASDDYDQALSGHLHLVPVEARLDALRRDYDKMKRDRMFFGEAPTLEEILESLEELEARINDAVRHVTEAKHD
jgi:predicted nucleotidyltransferase component of viral defense system